MPRGAAARRRSSRRKRGGSHAGDPGEPQEERGVGQRQPTVGESRCRDSSDEVPECSATACDEFDLRLDLPKKTWKKKREGGVEVSIRWFGTCGDNVRLYVYWRGSLLAKSDGIIASAQSVLNRRPRTSRRDASCAQTPATSRRPRPTERASVRRTLASFPRREWPPREGLRPRFRPIGT